MNTRQNNHVRILATFDAPLPQGVSFCYILDWTRTRHPELALVPKFSSSRLSPRGVKHTSQAGENVNVSEKQIQGIGLAVEYVLLTRTESCHADFASFKWFTQVRSTVNKLPFLSTLLEPRRIHYRNA